MFWTLGFDDASPLKYLSQKKYAQKNKTHHMHANILYIVNATQPF